MNSQTPAGMIGIARQLLSGRFQGVLATNSLDCVGYPVGSLLPYSIGGDGWPRILISHLAKHTRNLIASSHCSLTIVEQGSGDTQQLARLVCLADALPVDASDETAQARHFRYFPESRGYYRDLNFLFYRLQPVRFYCVTGFGAARWIGVDRMQAAPPFDCSEEQETLALINRSFPKRLGEAVSTGSGTALAVGVDPQGLDLLQGGMPVRFEFPPGVHSCAEILAQLSDWLPGQ